METTHERLRILIANARQELRGEGGSHGGLLDQLDVLDRSLGATDPSVELLSSTLRAFPAKQTRTRGGVPAGLGLKETRRLWEELNRIVEARQQPEAKEMPTRPPEQR